MGSYPSVAAGYKPESAMQGYADMQKLEENQLAQKVQQQQLQEGALNIQAKQQALSDVKVMNDAWTNSLRSPQASAPPAGTVPLSGLLGGAPTAAPGVVGAVPASRAQGSDSGAPVYDHDKIMNYLASNGKGSLIPGLQKSWLDLDKTAGEVQAAKDKHTADATDYFGDLGIAVRNANYDPAAVGTMLAHAGANGYGPEAKQLLEELSQDPTKIKPVIDAVIARSPKQAELGNARTAANAKQSEADTAAGRLQFEQRTKGQVTPEDIYREGQENYRATLQRQAQGATTRQNQGIQNLQKQADDYSKFLSTANSLKQSLIAAQNGNEMAAAVAPLQGTLFITTSEGVRRINETELRGVTGAGSLVQRINGALGKTSGKGPLSDQLKQDMASLVDIYTASKYKQYANQAQYTMKLHGVDAASTPILDQDGSIAGSTPAQPSSAAGGAHPLDKFWH